MEYLLLRDGSVRVFERTLSHGEVFALMAEPTSDAYYWHTPEFAWSRFTVWGKEVFITHNITDLPDVVKLAAMLE